MGVDLYFTNIVRIDEIKEKTDLKIEMQSNSEEYQDYLISDGEGEIYCYTNKGVVSFFKWGNGASSVLRTICLYLQVSFLDDAQEEELLYMKMDMEHKNLEMLDIYPYACKLFPSKEERDEYVQKESLEIKERREKIKKDNDLPF